eukprot:TRINITY_DN96275_c0_g1_i1.p1 TRINITY_DN96275_c0_g1~~TRINITY_DN96275_c0_g1_i1.p1  ORF type:complete len:357 (+),score=24.93 TRINITY_DN96275_c0_g1_i1:23-1072(+)
MTEAFRRQLDELMGKNRNGGESRKTNYWDAEVCKDYLLGTCVHDLFTNTRVYTGPCQNLHDPVLKTAFEEDEGPRKRDLRRRWTRDLINTLTGRVAECERKIQKAADRLRDRQPTKEDATSTPEVKEMDARIQEKTTAAEAAGDEGNIEQCTKLMEEVEELKKKRDETVTKNMQPTGGAQALRVCEICGAYLDRDTEQRMQDHLLGKLHLGYKDIRDSLATLKEFMESSREEGDRYDREREDRDRFRGPSSSSSYNRAGGRDERRDDYRRDDRRDDRGRDDYRRRDDRGYSSRYDRRDDYRRDDRGGYRERDDRGHRRDDRHDRDRGHRRERSRSPRDRDDRDKRRRYD